MYQQHWNILIVEDIPEDQVAICRYLIHDKSTKYIIHEASNGARGLIQCASLQLDCVLLDYNLPDMTGAAFLDHVRVKQPFLPIVVLTGNGSEMIAVQSMKRGAQDYILKEQFTSEYLHYVIANAIEKMAMQRRVEEQRQEIDQQRYAFQMLAENAPDIIARFDPDFRHVYINPAITRATGLPVEAFLGKSNRELGMPEDLCAVWDKRLSEVFVTRQRVQLEYMFPSPSGPLFYQAHLAPEFNAEGQVISVLSISRDVTDLKRAEKALRESEERMRLAISAARMGTWDWDITTGQILWSEDLEALLGFAPGTFGGTYEAFAALVYPDDHAHVEQLLQQALEQHTEYQAEFRMRCVDGSIRWTTTRANIIYNEEDRPIRMIGIDLDITERRQAEIRSIERASELEAIFEAISDGLFLLDAYGTPTRLNRAAREFLGVPTGVLTEHLSVPPFSFFDERGHMLLAEQRPEARLLMGQHLVGSTAAEVRLRRPDGREIELSVTGTPLSAEEGKISGAIMVARDVTARRSLELRTHAALDALLLMAESLVSGEITSPLTGETTRGVMQHLAELTSRVLDCEGAVFMVLAPATDLIEDTVVTGFSDPTGYVLRMRVQGAYLSDRFQEDPHIMGQLREGKAVLLDVSQPQYRERQPRSYLHQAILIPICLHGDLIGMMTLYPTDPHHNYPAEEITLAEAVGKLAALVIERERLLYEREEARASSLAARETTQRMDDFIGIVSHELKTPLTSLRGNFQLAKRQLKGIPPGEVDPEGLASQAITAAQKSLDRAERQVTAQNRLVNDLIDVTRIRMDKLDLKITQCDLQQLVLEVIEDQRRLTTTRTIYFNGSEVEAQVQADSQRVGQVVNNYLSNALKYSDDNTPVEVRIELQESVVQVSVRDEGPGLSPEVQQHIWDRFYRVPGVEVKSGAGVGLGLGLHICRTIIERQGGTVGVHSVQGQGSTFWFTLPVVQGASNDLREECQNNSTSTSTAYSNHS